MPVRVPDPLLPQQLKRKQERIAGFNYRNFVKYSVIHETSIVQSATLYRSILTRSDPIPVCAGQPPSDAYNEAKPVLMQINITGMVFSKLNIKKNTRGNVMCASLVVVAESSRARIFAMENPNTPLNELRDMLHPEGRAHMQELTSDLPGRSFDSHGQGRHSLEVPVDVKEQEAIAFAEQLADFINSKFNGNEMDRLYIAAAPHFLGHLRKKLGDEAKHHIVRQLNKNLVTMDEAEIRRHLF